MVALSSKPEKCSTWRSSDNLGTVRDLAEYDDATDTTAIVDHYVYDAFGNETDHTGPNDFLFKYTGRAFDDETGLQNNLNRWFDPTVGRWLNEDPIGFEAGDANVYRYVGNASTLYTDPSGLEVQSVPASRDAPYAVTLIIRLQYEDGTELAEGNDRIAGNKDFTNACKSYSDQIAADKGRSFEIIVETVSSPQGFGYDALKRKVADLLKRDPRIAKAGIKHIILVGHGMSSADASGMAWPLSGHETVDSRAVTAEQNRLEGYQLGKPNDSRASRPVTLWDALIDHDGIRDNVRQIDLEGCFTAREAKAIAEEWKVRAGGYHKQIKFGAGIPTAERGTRKQYYGTLPGSPPSAMGRPPIDLERDLSDSLFSSRPDYTPLGGAIDSIGDPFRVIR